MADVHVKVTNKSGGVVTLLMDEEDERVAYLSKLVKRDELEAVSVSKPKAKASTPSPA